MVYLVENWETLTQQKHADIYVQKTMADVEKAKIDVQRSQLELQRDIVGFEKTKLIENNTPRHVPGRQIEWKEYETKDEKKNE